MDDEQFRALRTLIAELRMSVESLRLDMKARHELEDQRYKLIFDGLYNLPEGDGADTEIEIPDDLKKFFPTKT